LTESEAAIKDPSSSIGAAIKEEVPTTTTSSVQADKPAALGESDKSIVEVVEEQVKTPQADSLATKEESLDDKNVQQDAVKPSNDEVTESPVLPVDPVKVAEAVTTQDEVKAVTEETVQSSRTGVLATEKEKVRADSFLLDVFFLIIYLFIFSFLLLERRLANSLKKIVHSRTEPSLSSFWPPFAPALPPWV
jgi:hypothetical protein